MSWSLCRPRFSCWVCDTTILNWFLCVNKKCWGVPHYFIKYICLLLLAHLLKKVFFLIKSHDASVKWIYCIQRLGWLCHSKPLICLFVIVSAISLTWWSVFKITEVPVDCSHLHLDFRNSWSALQTFLVTFGLDLCTNYEKKVLFDVLTHTCNHSPQEAEARSWGVWGKSGLQGEWDTVSSVWGKCSP